MYSISVVTPFTELKTGDIISLNESAFTRNFSDTEYKCIFINCFVNPNSQKVTLHVFRLDTLSCYTLQNIYPVYEGLLYNDVDNHALNKLKNTLSTVSTEDNKIKIIKSIYVDTENISYFIIYDKEFITNKSTMVDAVVYKCFSINYFNSFERYIIYNDDSECGVTMDELPPLIKMNLLLLCSIFNPKNQ